MINPLFDGLTYNMTDILLIDRKKNKILPNSQNVCAYYKLNHSLSCTYSFYAHSSGKAFCLK